MRDGGYNEGWLVLSAFGDAPITLYHTGHINTITLYQNTNDKNHSTGILH